MILSTRARLEPWKRALALSGIHGLGWASRIDWGQYNLGGGPGNLVGGNGAYQFGTAFRDGLVVNANGPVPPGFVRLVDGTVLAPLYEYQGLAVGNLLDPAAVDPKLVFTGDVASEPSPDPAAAWAGFMANLQQVTAAANAKAAQLGIQVATQAAAGGDDPAPVPAVPAPAGNSAGSTVQAASLPWYIPTSAASAFQTLLNSSLQLGSFAVPYWLIGIAGLGAAWLFHEEKA